MNFNSQTLHLSVPCHIPESLHSGWGDVKSIHDYVERRAALMTLEHLEEVRLELPLLRIQFAGIAAARFPHLPGQLKLLANFFQDSFDTVFQPVAAAAVKEAALALRYAAKNADIIPNFVEEIGYANNSLIVRTVLRRHQDVFHKYCRFRDILWSNITLSA